MLGHDPNTLLFVCNLEHLHLQLSLFAAKNVSLSRDISAVLLFFLSLSLSLQNPNSNSL